MRILILGGDGMLGHQLLTYLQPNHEVCVTLRRALSNYAEFEIFNGHNSFDQVELPCLERLTAVLNDFQPQVLINAVGIIKQRDAAKAVIPSIEVNALLPHRLNEWCLAKGIRFIHFSTDCVFSGELGNYKEDDFADARDLYGRTKFLGEVVNGHCITLRTSIIGLELSRKKSLIEWFLSQEGEVKGFTKAIFSGLTTLEICRVVEKILVQPQLSGLYQVSAESVSKYSLLKTLCEKLGKNIRIVPDGGFICDRSLCSEKFKSDAGWVSPSWDRMLTELAAQIKLRDKA